VPLINTICFENSSLYLGLYQMWVPWLGQLRVVKFRNTLGAKGYNGFHSIYFLLDSHCSYGGGKKRGKLGECSNYEYTRMLLCFAELQSLMIAAIPNIIGWLAISFAKVSERR
jgi:hypothetical protein